MLSYVDVFFDSRWRQLRTDKTRDLLALCDEVAEKFPPRARKSDAEVNEEALVGRIGGLMADFRSWMFAEALAGKVFAASLTEQNTWLAKWGRISHRRPSGSAVDRRSQNICQWNAITATFAVAV